MSYSLNIFILDRNAFTCGKSQTQKNLHVRAHVSERCWWEVKTAISRSSDLMKPLPNIYVFTLNLLISQSRKDQAALSVFMLLLCDPCHSSSYLHVTDCVHVQEYLLLSRPAVDCITSGRLHYAALHKAIWCSRHNPAQRAHIWDLQLSCVTSLRASHRKRRVREVLSSHPGQEGPAEHLMSEQSSGCSTNVPLL